LVINPVYVRPFEIEYFSNSNQLKGFSYFATMHGEKMELCVTEPGKDLRVVACHMMKKN